MHEEEIAAVVEQWHEQLVADARLEFIADSGGWRRASRRCGCRAARQVRRVEPLREARQ